MTDKSVPQPGSQLQQFNTPLEQISDALNSRRGLTVTWFSEGKGNKPKPEITVQLDEKQDMLELEQVLHTLHAHIDEIKIKSKKGVITAEIFFLSSKDLEDGSGKLDEPTSAEGAPKQKEKLKEKEKEEKDDDDGKGGGGGGEKPPKK